MQENIKQKLPIIIGVGLPLVLILWILVFVYILPSIFVKPKYNFIYVTGYENQYIRVINRKIQIDPCPYNYYESCSSYLHNVNFYLYDVKNNESTPLSLEEVEEYKLDSSEKSTDSYVVRSSRDQGSDFYFFPFFWGSGVREGYYIGKDGGLSKKISLKDDYYYNFKFLGWILE